MAGAKLPACWNPALNSAGLHDAAAQHCFIPAVLEAAPATLLSIS